MGKTNVVARDRNARLGYGCGVDRTDRRVAACTAAKPLPRPKIKGLGNLDAKTERPSSQRQQPSESDQENHGRYAIGVAALIPFVGQIDWWLEMAQWGPFAILSGYLIWDLRQKDGQRERRMADRITTLETSLLERSAAEAKAVEALKDNSAVLQALQGTMKSLIQKIDSMDEATKLLHTQLVNRPCQMTKEELARLIRPKE